MALEAALRRWMDAGLIDDALADRIRRHEAAGAEPARRLPPAAEAIADLGIVLGIASAAVAWGSLAERHDDGVRLLLSAVVTTALLAGGALLRRSREPGVQRIASALWLFGSLGTGIVVVDVYALGGDMDDLPSVVTLGAGVPMLVTGWATHTIARRTPTLVGAFAGTVTTGVGLVTWWLADAGDAEPVAIAVVLVSIGAAWVAAVLTGRLRPRGDAAILLGALSLLIAPLFVAEVATGASLLIGVGISAVLMGIGVRVPGWALMIVGAIGSFGYLTGTLVHFFQDSLGVPLVLLIAGAILVALALLLVRLRRPSEEDRGA